MSEKQETPTDIIAEMRGIRVREFQDYADRFEAALKRERGDCAKLRDALEKIAHYDDDRYNMDDPCCADGHICADIARQALGMEGGAK